MSTPLTIESVHVYGQMLLPGVCAVCMLLCVWVRGHVTGPGCSNGETIAYSKWLIPKAGVDWKNRCVEEAVLSIEQGESTSTSQPCTRFSLMLH